MSTLHESQKIEEYRTLREELLQAKKYVFERPLLIVVVGFAGLKGVDNMQHISPLLVIVAILLLFNFWFTVNRLFSAARIVAYIQLELEGNTDRKWRGWETCLREYRRVVKHELIHDKSDISIKPDDEVIPDALMYYPTIYMLHIGLMFFTFFSSIFLAVTVKGILTIGCMVLVLLLTSGFVMQLYRYRPQLMRTISEQNRAIWLHVFASMQARENKITALIIRKQAIKRDSVLITGGRGARKILVTELQNDNERLADCVEWSPPENAKKCPVQVMSDTEVAVFNQEAIQELHYHRNGTEMYTVLEGEMVIEVDGQDYKLNTGDMIVVNPNSVHEVKRETEFLCQTVTVNCGGEKDKIKVGNE